MPQLRSITDTTYFPTDEIEQGVVEDTAPDTNSGSDLAFLGYVSAEPPCKVCTNETFSDIPSSASTSGTKAPFVQFMLSDRMGCIMVGGIWSVSALIYSTLVTLRYQVSD